MAAIRTTNLAAVSNASDLNKYISSPVKHKQFHKITEVHNLVQNVEYGKVLIADYHT